MLRNPRESPRTLCFFERYPRPCERSHEIASDPPFGGRKLAPCGKNRRHRIAEPLPPTAWNVPRRLDPPAHRRNPRPGRQNPALTARTAERGGFEPPNEVNPRYAISSRARSTAPAPLRSAGGSVARGGAGVRRRAGGCGASGGAGSRRAVARTAASGARWRGVARTGPTERPAQSWPVCIVRHSLREIGGVAFELPSAVHDGPKPSLRPRGGASCTCGDAAAGDSAGARSFVAG